MRKEDDNFHIFSDKIIFPFYFLFVLNIVQCSRSVMIMIMFILIVSH